MSHGYLYAIYPGVIPIEGFLDPIVNYVLTFGGASEAH